MNLSTPCVIWEGADNGNGYGQIKIDRRTYYVHRLAYTEAYGTVPREIDHGCRNHSCWNVAHLEDVSHQANMARSERARRPHCLRGHPYNATNTRIDTDGSRRCRVCQRDDARVRRAA